MKKITYGQLRDAMWKFNEEHHITNKGTGPELYGVVVMTEDSFDKPYSVESRSYRFNNHNKAFISGMISNSIFANCLDGTDNGVRLDWYIGDGWKVDYCYLEN